MLQIAKSPLGRRLWRIAKTLHIPISDAAKMTPEQLDFCDFSMLADDPKKLQDYENSYYDPDYEAFEKAFDAQIQEKQEEQILMRETEADRLRKEGYDVSAEVSADDEWERVEDDG